MSYLQVINSVLAVLAVVIALRAAYVAKETQRWVEVSNKKSVGLKQLTQLSAEMAEHADSIAALSKSMRTLRSRKSMRDLRAGKSNGSDVPDPATDPEGWKRHMRLQLHLKGKPNASR